MVLFVDYFCNRKLKRTPALQNVMFIVWWVCDGGDFPVHFRGRTGCVQYIWRLNFTWIFTQNRCHTTVTIHGTDQNRGWKTWRTMRRIRGGLPLLCNRMDFRKCLHLWDRDFFFVLVQLGLEKTYDQKRIRMRLEFQKRCLFFSSIVWKQFKSHSFSRELELLEIATRNVLIELVLSKSFLFGHDGFWECYINFSVKTKDSKKWVSH